MSHENDNKKLLQQYERIIDQLMNCVRYHKGKCTVEDFMRELKLE